MDIDTDMFSRTFRSSDGYGIGTGMRPSLLNDWIIGGRRRKNQKSASKKLDGFAVRTNSVVPILSLGPWNCRDFSVPKLPQFRQKTPSRPTLRVKLHDRGGWQCGGVPIPHSECWSGWPAPRKVLSSSAVADASELGKMILVTSP